MNGSESKTDVRTTALRVGAVVLTVILLLSTGLFLVKLWERNFGKKPEAPETLDRTLSYNGKSYVLKENVETFLVLGLDKADNQDSGSYNNDKQADFLVLFVFDNEEKSCKAIQINRDTMVEMNVLGVAGDKVGSYYGQIALSHTFGNGKEVSCGNTAKAVSGLLMGAEVDHYLSVTLDAVAVCNDLVGGVTVEVLDDLTSVDAALVKGETVTLQGKQALWYVRSRYGLEDPTNLDRMKRQKQYADALRQKSRLMAEQDESFIAKAVLEMAEYMVSDCSTTRLQSLLERVSSYADQSMIQIEGTSVKGERFMEFYPDRDSLTQTVIECFYVERDEK